MKFHFHAIVNTLFKESLAKSLVYHFCMIKCTRMSSEFCWFGLSVLLCYYQLDSHELLCVVVSLPYIYRSKIVLETVVFRFSSYFTAMWTCLCKLRGMSVSFEEILSPTFILLVMVSVFENVLLQAYVPLSSPICIKKMHDL